MTELTFILVLVLGLEFGAANSSGHRQNVSRWQEFFKASDFCQTEDCQTQINNAKTRGQNQSTDDLKAAVEMIYTYSSNEPKTFKEVNAILRGDPNSKVSQKDETMFREFATILAQSTELLCIKFPNICGRHGPVYRGQGYCVSINCSTRVYPFNSFLSTSKNIKIAEQFYGGCQNSSVLFEMTTVEGIYIRNFSRYPSEEEVLIKPPAILYISKNLNSTRNASHLDGIKEVIQSKNRTIYPKAYIVGSMVGSKRSVPVHSCASAVRTSTPVVHTSAPVVHTNAPVVHTNAPVVHTNAPVVHTNAPVVHTNAPVVHPGASGVQSSASGVFFGTKYTGAALAMLVCTSFRIFFFI